MAMVESIDGMVVGWDDDDWQEWCCDDVIRLKLANAIA
jgi:hypothetical protein